MTNQPTPTAKQRAKYGIEEGDKCNRNGCDGNMSVAHDDDRSCSCYISPPCSCCTDSRIECDKCNLDTEEPLYMVLRYFDDVLEAVVASGLTKGDADRVRIKYKNEKPRCYVTFDVKEDMNDVSDSLPPTQTAKSQPTPTAKQFIEKRHREIAFYKRQPLNEKNWKEALYEYLDNYLPESND